MAAQPKALPQNAVIGILGGGQLGRMLALAAARLGFRCHIYCPEAGGPAAQVADRETNAPYEDLDAIHTFAKACDIVTYEFENVPAMAAKTAGNASILHPNGRALDVAQDRITEKTFIRDQARVPVAPFQPVDSVFDARRAARHMGMPCVLKTRRFGYDGKGQAIIRSEADIDAAADLLDQPCILEGFVDFTREVSVIAARGANGQSAAYPLIENVHENHILATSTAPALRDTGAAQTLALKIMEALDYIGVMGTEFFELPDGSLIVNEIAPRVHNSGHWTQDAGCVDQFELHIRAIAGWPLGDTTPRFKMQMHNLIGDDVNNLGTILAETNASLHLYGKSEARPGRKMGHVNRKLPH